MKKLYIVANWKSNMTETEAKHWLQGFTIDDSGFKNDKEVIICPPFTLLPFLKSHIVNHKSTLQLGAQDVSPFPKGAYTGEVVAEQIKELASYVIIGHSERRKYFHEDEQTLSNKVDMAIDSGLIPIFCVQDDRIDVPTGVMVVAYEPIFAIGSGNPDTPENAEEVAKAIREKTGASVLYGGSVTDENVHAFTQKEHIAGVLVGSASLNSNTFSRLITNA